MSQAEESPFKGKTGLRRLINAKHVTVDGLRVKAAHTLRAGESIQVTLVPPQRELPQGEDIPLEILYEDQ